ncbi:endonuclease/Exonuclease/phosphatase [Sodiomyces alkalinus F11]|uniref:Endonuclease/Exonuclease/phosphatase n=1 Tax=Sodiomyces alkalinus (strain CBS 110278 / VKM F-3762 / F11) TaxID=1314773 RepID=A0A3N2PUG3_SODAK|nr:endonuclease/Exonuclease/phosphatase [Sodiomyces alkalinus F11]ROT38147.1 endonuclease/Exonuclease/phosphatase [Sodiomyces alkalinus F11]
MRRYTLASLAGGVVSAALAAASQTAGDLSVLAMNVAGLPDFLQGNEVPGDKAENHRIIGSKFVEYGYDVINVQEDFNYHAALYSTATLPHRTPTSGGVPFGSGLNTLSLHPFIDQTRVKWNECSNTSGADCLTPKGFTLVRVALASGPEGAAYVDVYNLHADAGISAADLAARASNLRQLSSYINAWSAGNAVIIAGDTNSRYSRTADDIRIFRRENAMKDPWVELIRNNVEPTAESLCTNPSTTDHCETVDKIFYRPGPLLDLRAEAWRYDASRFLQPNGAILSDHNPVAANFTWSLPSTLRQSDFHGGPHGTWFSDAAALASLHVGTTPRRASVIRFRGASRVDAVSLSLSDGSTFSHGGSGGQLAELRLADREVWSDATLCQAQRDGRTRIFYIKARTSAGRSLKAGQATADCAHFKAPAGWGIVGFLGRGGSEIDRLAFVYARQ